jgi:hypothetical protein
MGRKSEEDRSRHNIADCGQSSGLAAHGQNRMWGEGCQKLYYAVRGHSHNFTLHAPYQMMDEDHSPQCGMDCNRSHGLGLHAEH